VWSVLRGYPHAPETNPVDYRASVRPGRSTAHAAWICGATAVAGAATVANRGGWLGFSHLAASPRAVAEGKIWLLLTSGVVADRPWLPSLLGFAIVGFAALSLARASVVVVAGLAGHVVATLLVYGFLGAADAIDHGAFANLVRRPDIGLSAIIAAWIGVISCVLWRRYRSPRAHVLNALGCIGCALVGFAFRPDVTALDSEHIVAFALGIAVAAWWPQPAAATAPDDVDRELEQLLTRA
jgi:lambda repressor-like predicted transcriptional regulator